MYAVGYYLGSNNSSTVYYAQINSTGTLGTWSPTTGMTFSSSYHPAFVNNGYLYSLGGYIPGGVTANISFASINSNGTLGSAVATSLPTALAQEGNVAYNGYVYTLGGYNGSTNTSTVYYAPFCH